MQKFNDLTDEPTLSRRQSNTLDAVIDALSGLQRMPLSGAAVIRRNQLDFMLCATFLGEDDDQGFSTAELIEAAKELMPLVSRPRDQACIDMLLESLVHLLPAYN